MIQVQRTACRFTPETYEPPAEPLSTRAGLANPALDHIRDALQSVVWFRQPHPAFDTFPGRAGHDLAFCLFNSISYAAGIQAWSRNENPSLGDREIIASMKTCASHCESANLRMRRILNGLNGQAHTPEANALRSYLDAADELIRPYITRFEFGAPGKLTEVRDERAVCVTLDEVVKLAKAVVLPDGANGKARAPGLPVLQETGT